MGTVTGYTATKMQEIVDGTVESGYINGSGHLILVLHDATEIDAGSALPALPTASDTVAGIVELATNAETITGTDATRAVTPAGLAAKTASSTAQGIVELATDAETITGTDTVRAITPANFAAGFASKSIDGLSDVTITTAATGHIIQYNGSAWVNSSTEALVVAATTTDAFTVKVTGDTQLRITINGDGKIEWGSGSVAPSVNLFFSAADILATDDNFLLTDNTKQINIGSSSSTAAIAEKLAATSTVGFSTRVTTDANNRFQVEGNGKISWGDGTAAVDTNLYRNAANQLATDDGILMTDSTKQLNIGSSGSGAAIAVKMASSGDGILTSRVGSDADSRLFIEATGTLYWGNGTNAQDTQLGRESAGVIGTTSSLNLTGATAGTDMYKVRVTGDSNIRLTIQANGQINWADGAGGNAVNLFRTSAILATDNDFAITTAGKGFRVKEGSNAKMGTSVLVGGTVTVSNTSVTANSRIFVTCQTPGGTPGFLRISARSAGTNFTILSSSGSDTSTVGWIIYEPS